MNKFQKVVSFALLLVAFTFAYYLLIYIPKRNEQSLSEKKAAQQISFQKEFRDAQVRANKYCLDKRDEALNDKDVQLARAYDAELNAQFEEIESDEWLNGCMAKMLVDWGYLEIVE